ncbi:MAG: septal ring lytic transglycosylase RlpA family protein [Solirubrobacteraceae bacterium]
MPASAKAVPLAQAAPARPLAVLAIDAQRPSVLVRPRVIFRERALNVLAGHVASVTGTLRPHLHHVSVVLELLDGRRWRGVAHTHTGARGRFRLRYVPRALGSWEAQVHVLGGAEARTSTRLLGRLSSYTAAIASWYGGGGTTACGGYLTSETLGVANRTLPCGTRVTIRYGGRVVTVPVIDRGPYVEGREFDLTEATKRVLGFEGVAEVWATR